jgi:hypothetical protein
MKPTQQTLVIRYQTEIEGLSTAGAGASRPVAANGPLRGVHSIAARNE